MSVTLAELLVADPPDAWRAAGFAVDDDGVCRVGSVRIRLAGGAQGRGVIGWSLRGLVDEPTEVDGVPAVAADEPEPEPAAPAGHPNGTTHIDQVVLLTPDLGRTIRALGEIGLEVRRQRDGEVGGSPMRQVFYRLGEVILEVVGAPDVAGEGPSTIWGLTHTVADIDAAAALLGEHASPVKDAVQPGRRITTLRTRELGMSVRTALISSL